jgi:hypothetical protein
MHRGMVGVLLFAFVLPGCVQDGPPSIAYQRTDGRPISFQQEEQDRAVCRSEAENAANAAAARAAQTGDYDLFRNIGLGQHEAVTEQSCLNQRGYEPVPAPRKGLFN